jgi:23S rRNA pseudouridine1911/1915/1917 synthase
MSEDILSLTIPEDAAPERADKLLAALLPQMSRSHVQRLLADGRVTLAGRPLAARGKLAPGDVVTLALPPPPPAALAPAEIPLDVLYEDEHLLAVNKHGGMVTHPGAGTGDDTLAHAALAHTGGALATAAGLLRPGIVHRLDKETSGVILLAKTDAAYHALVRQFAEREPDKQYIALVAPCPALLSGSERGAIGRHRSNRVKMSVREDGKPARTDWEVEERFGTAAARVRCYLFTGRTHQIRVHLAHIGFPILGDVSYGKTGVVALAGAPVARVMLHAERISLAHPVTGKPLVITAPMPADFLAAETWLRGCFGGRPVARLDASWAPPLPPAPTAKPAVRRARTPKLAGGALLLGHPFAAAVFDMDGLLLDTERVSMQAWRAAAVRYGIALPDAVFLEMVGRRREDCLAVLRRFAGAATPPEAEFSALVSEQYEALLAAGVPLKKGARELLRFLTTAGTPLAVATSTDLAEAQDKLSRAGLAGFFKSATGGDCVAHGKPAPDIYLAAAAALGVAPAECVAFEDSGPGTLAAAAAGMRVVLVPDLLTPPLDIRRKAAAVCASLEEAAALCGMHRYAPI